MYSEIIPRELDDRPGFIIEWHNLNKMRYTVVTVLVAVSEKQLKEQLSKVVEESKKKWLAINCKETRNIVVGIPWIEFATNKEIPMSTK